jgi:tetratricopeptide (TPR) repeat protein
MDVQLFALGGADPGGTFIVMSPETFVTVGSVAVVVLVFLILSRRKRPSGLAGGAHADQGAPLPHFAEIEDLERSLAAARQSGDPRAEGKALRALAYGHLLRGEGHRAIALHNEDLAAARALGSRSGERDALANIGVAHADLGTAREAIPFFERALAISREIGDPTGEADALVCLGNAHAALDETREAVELYEQSITVARAIDNQASAAFTSSNLAGEYEKLGDLPRAIEALERYVSFVRAAETPGIDEDEARLEALRARLAERQGEGA